MAFDEGVGDGAGLSEGIGLGEGVGVGLGNGVDVGVGEDDADPLLQPTFVALPFADAAEHELPPVAVFEPFVLPLLIVMLIEPPAADDAEGEGSTELTPPLMALLLPLPPHPARSAAATTEAKRQRPLTRARRHHRVNGPPQTNVARKVRCAPLAPRKNLPA
jgi:hypothetical protein